MTENANQKFFIDDVEYDMTEMSENAKAQLNNIHFVDLQLQQLNNEWAIADTARIGYENALRAELTPKDWTVLNMVEKINLDGQEYLTKDLNSEGKDLLDKLNFTVSRIEELTNTQALLQRAKISYAESLKKEILSKKAGLNFD